MLRMMLTVVSVMAVVGAGAPALAGGCEGCEKAAMEGEGFHCGKGKAFGVALTSKMLYKALWGRQIYPDKIQCIGCKYAAKTEGHCAHCKLTAVKGKFYNSSVSIALAKGTRISAEKVAACSGCKTAHGEDGFCKGCSAGFVGGRMFKGKEAYEAAQGAFKTLTKAAVAAKKCNTCAVAMITDGKCEECDVTFKDGKATG